MYLHAVIKLVKYKSYNYCMQQWPPVQCIILARAAMVPLPHGSKMGVGEVGEAASCDKPSPMVLTNSIKPCSGQIPGLSNGGDGGCGVDLRAPLPLVRITRKRPGGARWWMSQSIRQTVLCKHACGGKDL